MKGLRRLAMPGGRTEGTLQVSIKSFDVPAQMIKFGQFRGWEHYRVQKRRYKAAAAKTVPVNENYSNLYHLFAAVILYFTDIVTLSLFAQHFGPQGFLGGNDEVGSPDQDLCESGAGIEA